ncbi:MAG: hypothetical protein ABEH35_09100 [Haloarculaceae archaeon]
MSPARDDDGDDGISRRTLVRLLILIGVGIPILVEAVTFAGLVTHSLGGGGADAATPTPDRPAGAGVGDEILEATTPTETIEDAAVRPGEDRWQFVLTVAVDNVGDSAYELRLRSVTTTGGDTVSGGGTTGRIAGGGNGTVTGVWSLPAGERPTRLSVTAVTYEDGTAETTDYTVRLASVPVRNE